MRRLFGLKRREGKLKDPDEYLAGPPPAAQSAVPPAPSRSPPPPARRENYYSDSDYRSVEPPDSISEPPFSRVHDVPMAGVGGSEFHQSVALAAPIEVVESPSFAFSDRSLPLSPIQIVRARLTSSHTTLASTYKASLDSRVDQTPPVGQKPALRSGRAVPEKRPTHGLLGNSRAPNTNAPAQTATPPRSRAPPVVETPPPPPHQNPKPLRDPPGERLPTRTPY